VQIECKSTLTSGYRLGILLRSGTSNNQVFDRERPATPNGRIRADGLARLTRLQKDFKKLNEDSHTQAGGFSIQSFRVDSFGIEEGFVGRVQCTGRVRVRQKGICNFFGP
jgi:hypothetical protein